MGLSPIDQILPMIAGGDSEDGQLRIPEAADHVEVDHGHRLFQRKRDLHMEPSRKPLFLTREGDENESPGQFFWLAGKMACQFDEAAEPDALSLAPLWIFMGTFQKRPRSGAAAGPRWS